MKNTGELGVNMKKLSFIIFLGFLVTPIQAFQLYRLLNQMNLNARQFAATTISHLVYGSKEAGDNKPGNRGDEPARQPQDQEQEKKEELGVVYFKDIVGINKVLSEVVELVDYLKNLEKYRLLGSKMPRGILLEGAPGCGKTMIAKAIATEANCYFEQVSGSSFIEGTGGVRVREAFARARSNKPSILFIDEFDSIACIDPSMLSGSGSGLEYKQTLNQLLTELDGFATDNSVIIIAVTNNAASLDPAVKRSGRFDRLIHVPLPDYQARKELLSHYLKKLPRLGDDITEEVYDHIVKESDGLCGADFQNMVNEMTIEAVREQSTQVCARHVKAGAEKVISQRTSFMKNEFKSFLKNV